MTPPPSLAPTDAQRRLLSRAYQPPSQWGTARMTHRRIQNHAQAQLELATGATVVKSLPVKLTVESTNICNLRCTACPTGLEKEGRKRGHFTLELFDWIMGELGPTLFEVELHNWGEPLLGRNVIPMIERVTAAGVSSTISTNFSIPFDDERAERLVESGLAVLGASIDGASQEAYEKYRVKGDLSLALENCRRVSRAKARLGWKTPELVWSFRVFPHNVHEVETARSLAEDIGMTFVPTRGWTLGAASEGLDDFNYPLPDGFADRCFFLWLQAVIHHDGGVAPCCGTFYAEDDFLRLASDAAGLEGASFQSAVWNGPSFVAAREMFRVRRGDADTRRLACFDCPVTVDFEGWKAHLRGELPKFQRTSSNELYNFFASRGPDQGPGLIQLRRR